MADLKYDANKDESNMPVAAILADIISDIGILAQKIGVKPDIGTWDDSAEDKKMSTEGLLSDIHMDIDNLREKVLKGTRPNKKPAGYLMAVGRMASRG